MLCVSSLLLEAGVTVQMSCNKVENRKKIDKHASAYNYDDNNGCTSNITFKRGKVINKDLTQNANNSNTKSPKILIELTEIRPWPLRDDCNKRVSLESRYGI